MLLLEPEIRVIVLYLCQSFLLEFLFHLISLLRYLIVVHSGYLRTGRAIYMTH